MKLREFFDIPNPWLTDAGTSAVLAFGWLILWLKFPFNLVNFCILAVVVVLLTRKIEKPLHLMVKPAWWFGVMNVCLIVAILTTVMVKCHFDDDGKNDIVVDVTGCGSHTFHR